MKKIYFIDGYSEVFDSLSEVRNHIWMQQDKQEYNGVWVLCSSDDYFGRIVKIDKNGNVVLTKNKYASWI